MKTAILLLIGALIGWQLNTRSIRFSIGNALGWCGVWLQVSFFRIRHLIVHKERLSTYYKRYDQKVKDDTYEPMGWPRGTFTEWQLSDGKQGIARFNSDLNGFHKVEGGNGPQGIERLVACRMKPVKGTYLGKAIGWVVEGETNAPVTHWKEIES